MDHKETIQKIFLAGVQAVLPSQLIANNLVIRNDQLIVRDLSLKLREIENIYVVGAGKASACMAAEVERILGERVTAGHIIVKYDHACRLKKIEVTEAGHPLPDANGANGTKKILGMLDKAGSNDLVICLISGGGSALMIDYPGNSSLEEIAQLNDLLIKSGASIHEINTVRKHLSRVKGGQLAKAAYPATVVTLVLSDVIGDPVDTIASGPTAADPTTFEDALGILSKYHMTDAVPAGIREHLHEGVHGNRNETLKPSDPVLQKTHNYIIGNNMLALEAAGIKARECGFHTAIVTDRLQGGSNDAADFVIDSSLKYKQNNLEKGPACLLFGGETTLEVTGSGLGGRNQHLALLCATKIDGLKGISVLAAGTDGTDGPTDATGAIVDAGTIGKAQLKGLDADVYLTSFDSYNFFKKTEGHVVTGPTMTNVMDMVIVVVE